MIELSTSVRLLIALTVLVYGYLVSFGRAPRDTRLAVAIAGLVPFFAWVAVPGLLSAGNLSIAMQVRRLSLLVGAAAVLARYATVRAEQKSLRWRVRGAIASAVLLLVAVVVASSNWLVGAAAAVSIVVVVRVSLSEASSDGDRSRSGDP